MVDIEPCLYHNFLVELKPGKATETARFNSATLPSLEKSNVLKYLTVGYYKDPRTGQFDLAKASIKIQTDLLTFLPCIKHIEVSGNPIAGIKSVKSTLAASSTPVLTTSNKDSWEPYGSGRQPGELGRPTERKWGYKGDRERRVDAIHTRPASIVNNAPKVTTARPAQTTTKWGYKPAQGTPLGAPPPGVDWGYSLASTPSVSNPSNPSGTTGVKQSGKSKWGPSEFTKQFLRMKETPSKKAAGPVKSSPPFKNDEVEIIVPVEPCKEYQFEMKIVSPQNAVVAKVSEIFLLALSDLPDYIPPPLTSVIEVKFLGGGKHTIVTQPNSPVPESCLLDYLEAVDTFANRIEHVANDLNSATRSVKEVQDKIQDKVELTQSERLSKLGCVCSSPRLEVNLGPAERHTLEYAGVYLYHGIHQSKPYFKLDLEKRSTAGGNINHISTPAQTPTSGRRKRFIGRVDGGGTTTTVSPVNFGVPQGSYAGASFSTKYPSWRDYLDISTQRPGTKYSNRYSGSSSLSSSSSSSSSLRTSSSNTKGPSVGCPDENANLQLRRNAEVLTKISSWKECARKCSEKASCQNWVWNHERAGQYALNCALMEGFGNKVTDTQSVAGRWDCNYQGSTGSAVPYPGTSGTAAKKPGTSGAGLLQPRSSVSGASGAYQPVGNVGGPSVPVSVPLVKPRFLYWDPKAKQWLIASEVGVGPALAEVTSLPNSSSKCPADNPTEVWKAKSGGQGVRVVCSPDY
eukprot:GFUD01066857.1.p1 GENE.GFUD01066857.1~~GFUD01066857.1.p1  ORF type:complete len:822 (-),score=173.57 GFUD01066857.1:393-2618(-)